MSERPAASNADGPRLLAGGNPQIPKGDGDGPVQAYLRAMPGWKSDVGVRLDALIEQAVPGVVKVVRWNQPLYGVGDGSYFVSFRCFTRYVKLTFFNGGQLSPLPPVSFKSPAERALHVHEGEELDEQRLLGWCAQSAALPGWTP